MSAYREAYTSKLTNFWPNSSIQQYNLTNSIVAYRASILQQQTRRELKSHNN